MWGPITFTASYAFGALIDWIKSLATPIKAGGAAAFRWWGAWHYSEHACCYRLVIKLYSYVWEYQIATDDFGWCELCLVWRSRTVNEKYARKGWSIDALMVPRG